MFMSGQMDNRLVLRDEYQPMAHGQAEQVGIRDLIVAEQPLKERVAQGMPVGRDRLVMIPRLLRHPRQHRCGLFHAHVACFRLGHVAQKAGFGKRANGPLERRSVKPLRHG